MRKNSKITDENKYRITLFNTNWKEEFLIYNFPLLPMPGDIIEINKDRELFFVYSRGFGIFKRESIIDVTLYGVMENDDHQSRSRWDSFKAELASEGK
ncbi:hypothetical protein [Mucilaginibacter flavus]|uniref:hypothetical protein n=1 Tax=Mucilaginibacter flavus TaxID=931504 RepID=UPI0025B3E159|nr:hypothetical protein [Mucilaginibacter flavus]MDN3580364.1 hypothetical protein [Mucilaginibacter flavus]